jgi:hypothetical protein
MALGSHCGQLMVNLPKRSSDRNVRNLVRDTIVHLARAFMSPEDSAKLEIVDDQFSWPQTVPADIRAAFRDEGEGSQPLAKFKEGEFAKAYLDHRAIRQPNVVLPATVRELDQLFPFRSAKFPEEKLDVWQYDDTRTWRRKILTKSRIGSDWRRIYRGSPNRVPVSFVETRNEIEAAIRRADGTRGWDFYAYNQEGVLESRPVFRTSHYTQVFAAAPYLCMSCHYSPDRGTFMLTPGNFKTFLDLADGTTR